MSGASPADAASSGLEPLPSLSPIQPSIAAATSASASTTGFGNADPTDVSQLTPADSALLHQWLYGALQSLLSQFESSLDELGLVVAHTSRLESLAELQPYLASNPAPACYLSLQSAHGCPALLVAEGGSKLGVAFWSVPLLVRTASRRFRDARGKVRSLPSSEPLPIDLQREVHECTRVLLLVNADHYSAWNARKRLLCQPSSASESQLLTPARELRLLNLVYSKHPKSGESWAHRRWVLSRLPEFRSDAHFPLPAPAAQSASTQSFDADAAPAAAPTATDDADALCSSPLFLSELAMCARTAELYPKNYYAWTHRSWLLSLLTTPAGLDAELERSADWVERHVNDHCGLHHRQRVWGRWMEVAMERLTRNGSGEEQADSASRDTLRVHENLPTLLRAWSNTYPLDDSSAPPLHVSSSTAASPPSSASAASAHASSVARCSFCSRFSATEYELLNELQLRYPAHESLWMHRRFVSSVAIESLAAHDPSMAHAPGAAPADASPSSDASPPIMPAWLDSLLQRELSYADAQIEDVELYDGARNAAFAAVYKVWLLHAAFCCLYRTRMLAARSASSPPYSAPPSSLFSFLSPPHRAWYARCVDDVLQLQPALPSRAHWMERAQALAAAATAAAPGNSRGLD